jgi:hypothetical protein
MFDHRIGWKIEGAPKPGDIDTPPVNERRDRPITEVLSDACCVDVFHPVFRFVFPDPGYEIDTTIEIVQKPLERLLLEIPIVESMQWWPWKPVVTDLIFVALFPKAVLAADLIILEAELLGATLNKFSCVGYPDPSVDVDDPVEIYCRREQRDEHSRE